MAERAVTAQYREADPDECDMYPIASERRDIFRDAGPAAPGALIMVGVPPGMATTTRAQVGNRLVAAPPDTVPSHPDTGTRDLT
jgi:hypothetical protein